jgi:hypothetical protein
MVKPERKTEPARHCSVVITIQLRSHREDTGQQQPGSCLDRICCDEKIALASSPSGISQSETMEHEVEQDKRHS